MAFNPEQFLNTEIAGATSTEYVPVPEGEWTGTCVDVSAKNVTFDDGHSALALTTQWDIVDPECKAAMGVERDPRVRYEFFLDFDEGGALKMGKGENVKLGKLREAVGLNDANKSFMPSMLKGQSAKLKTGHRLGKDGVTYSEVKAVAAL